MILKKHFLSVLCCVVVFLYLIPSQVKAQEIDDNEVSVVVHKLVVSEKDYIELDNNGQELSSDQLPAMRGINNVEFTLYDITLQLLNKLNKGMQLEAAQKELMEEEKDYNLSQLTVLDKRWTQAINGEDGVAFFSLNKSAEPKAYLLVESQESKEIQTKSDNIVLICPSFDEFGNELSQIHVYPKSVVKGEIPSTDGTGDEKQNTKATITDKEESIRLFPKTNERQEKIIVIVGACLLIVALRKMRRRRI